MGYIFIFRYSKCLLQMRLLFVFFFFRVGGVGQNFINVIKNILRALLAEDGFYKKESLHALSVMISNTKNFFNMAL